MKLSRLNLLTLAVVLVTAIVAAWYGPQLPDPVPTHWNMHGEVDGWMAKPWGVWLIPLVSAATTAVLFVLPLVAPAGFRLDVARRFWDLLVLVLALFLCAVMVLAFRDALGQGPGVAVGVPVLVGALFILIGNYLPKFPRNFFIGIRTPWTLASDEVWYRTHRVGGWAFMIAGVVVIISGALAGIGTAVIVTVVACALAPLLYSLWLYKRLHGFGGEGDS